jgi:plastocyanin
VAPSVAPSVAPPPSAASSAAASGGTGTTLTVTAPVGAATGGFQPTSLEATANTPFTIHFDNQDNQAPHNVHLTGPGGDVALGGDTAFFTGPGTRDYTVPALAAGAYQYMCQVHPTTMKGTLTVK